MDKEGDGDGNPSHVAVDLCASYRAHLETKIGDMEKNIRWSIYLASTVMGIVLILVQLYLKGAA